MDKTKLLLFVTCIALAAVVVWQQSAGRSDAPAPLQLITPNAAPAANSAAPASAESAAAAPAADTAAAPVASAPARKPAPRREARRAPAAIAASPDKAVVPAAAPVVMSAPAPAAEAPGEADTYEAQAAARMQQGDYQKAGELFEAALRNGGKASFAIVHDHSKGNFEKDPKASCVGELIMSENEIRFAGAGMGDTHQFDATWTEVREAGSNRFFGSGIGGFHLAINPGGKYKNFNLAPRSKDKAEAKLIVDLLNANARKTDRGK